MMACKRGLFQAVATLMVFLILGQPFAGAQSLPPGLIDQLNRANQDNNAYDPAQALPSPLDQTRTRQQPGQVSPQPNPPPQERSKLELDYSQRAGATLSQFGYDTFRTLAPSSGDLQNGGLPDDYQLNIGDELVITLRGQVSRAVRTRIDREGRLVIPDLPPIPAAGRSFGDMRTDLERQVAATFLNTQVYVSVGTVRQISVAVLGEAVAPGLYRTGGFATVLDVLAMARGVKKTGSLRRISLIRAGHSTTIDLYAVLIGTGASSNLGLADGDRIVIPPIGPNLAVSGAVDRPGIYEMAGATTIGAQEIFRLAGAPLRPNGNRFVKLSPDASGRDITTQLATQAGLTLRSGDILMVLRQNDLNVGSVRLDGHVTVPGIRSLAAAPDVKSLIGTSDTFLENPYLLFGVIETTDARTRARILVPVNLDAIMSGQQRVPLKDGDTVIVLGMGDMNYLGSTDVQAVLQGLTPPSMTQRIVTVNPRGTASLQSTDEVPKPSAEQAAALQPTAAQQQAVSQQAVSTQQQAVLNAPPNPGNLAQICRGLQALATVAGPSQRGRFANAILAATTSPTSANPLPNNFLCPKLFDQYPDLLPLAVEHAASVQGEVRTPGLYPVVAGTPLSSVIADAGGLSLAVDLSRVEVTHFAIDNVQGRSDAVRELVKLSPADLAKVAVGPGDVIRFNAVFIDRDNGPVTLSGEFRRPGNYDIRHGERLSEVIARAGGITDQAYPYGAVFTRESVKRQQQASLDREVLQINAALSGALTHTLSANQSPEALIAASQGFAAQIKSTPAVGRVVVEADPTVLQVRPQLDPIMEPGDAIFMPKRPTYVSVVGEVLNPATLQFRSGATPADYINQAGGYTESANKDGIFVVLPNGEAEPVKVSYWNFTPVQVPPGSSIYVSQDLRPFDLTAFLTSSTQIMSQLAISAASLAVIHGNSTR